MSVLELTANYLLRKFTRGHSVLDTDLGHNADIIDAELFTRLQRLSTTPVAFDATGQTTIYTVPAGKIYVPTMIIIRAGSDAGLTDITLGRVGALTDWMDTVQLDNLDADGDQVKVTPMNTNPPPKSKTYAAGVVCQIDVTVAAGGAVNYVDLFGYLLDV